MIRLTGGEFNGRALATPPTLKTRPSQAKLRQALLNSLQMRIPEAHVLDLFAGSGALGFESLSRGAAQAVFVEDHRAAIAAIEKNIETLGVKDRAILMKESVEGIWGQLNKQLKSSSFDVIFADPPYAEGWEIKLLQTAPWEQVLNPGGVFCLEWGIHKSKIDGLPEEAGCLVKIRERNYGDSVLTHYERKA